MPPTHRPRQTAGLIAEHLGTGAVAYSDVLALGLSEGQVRAAVASGALRRLRRGVLQVTPAVAPNETVGSVSERDRALSVVEGMDDDALVSHASAASLWHLPQPRPGPPSPEVWVTAPRRHGDIARPVHLRLGAVPPEDREIVEGVRCTGLARTALDMARFRPLMESLVVLDAALRRLERADLWAALERHPMTYGRRGLREAIREADARAESPLESGSRGLMLQARLPRPELQRTVWVEGAAYRMDFYWDGKRVAGEADGWGKLQSIDDLRAEKTREDALRRFGLTVVRWTSDELWRRPNLVVSRLRTHLT